MKSRLAAVAALLIGLGLLVALPTGPALAKGKHGPVAWPSPLVSCSYSGRTLTQLKVNPPRVSMDKKLAKAGGRAQYVGVRVVLQGLKAGRWTKVAKRPKKRDYSVTVKVHPRKKKSVGHKKLLTFRGSALPSAYSSFRAKVTLQWYAYNGHTVRGSLSRTSNACVRTTQNVVRISAGSGYACAQMTNGSMRCWGYNGSGRLGTGNTAEQTRPVTPRGMTAGVRSITTSTGTTCASVNYTVRCWGRNDTGQIGDGTKVARTVPTRVTRVPAPAYNVFSSGSALGNCATTGNNGLMCWGSDSYGQVTGAASSTAVSPTTLKLAGGASGVSASVGSTLGCAVISSTAQVQCWGSNAYGQARGTAPASGAVAPNVISSVANLTGVSAVTTGAYHACAIAAGGVKCWGRNVVGQLGHGTYSTWGSPVSAVGLTSNVTAISAANNSTCAVKSGAVYCWGDNTNGQLGNGTTNNANKPVRVGSISDAVGVALGLTAGYAWDAAGHVWAWGDNTYGQLGNGTTTASLRPVLVSIH